jgi:hypothetical protein
MMRRTWHRELRFFLLPELLPPLALFALEHNGQMHLVDAGDDDTWVEAYRAHPEGPRAYFQADSGSDWNLAHVRTIC